MKRDRDAQALREEAAHRRAAEAAGQPAVKTQARFWYQVEQWDAGSNDEIPILSRDEYEQLHPVYRIQTWDPDQRADFATRPMEWTEEWLNLPTGYWNVLVVRFAGTSDDVARRFWVWDRYRAEQFRRAADPAIFWMGSFRQRRLRTEVLLAESQRLPGSAWQDGAALRDALQADLEAVERQLASRPLDLDDPWVVFGLVEDRERDISSTWRRFYSWLLEQAEKTSDAMLSEVAS